MTGKFKLISDLFAANGLTDGYTVQNLSFFDSGDLSERFIVFRPAGGGNIDAIISSEHYVDVVIVSAGQQVSGEYERSFNDVSAIIAYVRDNPNVSACIGQMTNMGSIPAPTLTSDGRMVWMLQISCLYGQP